MSGASKFSLLRQDEVDRIEGELKDLVEKYERKFSAEMKNEENSIDKEAFASAINPSVEPPSKENEPDKKSSELRGTKRRRDEASIVASAQIASPSLSEDIALVLNNRRLVAEIRRMKSEQIHVEKKDSQARVNFLDEQEKFRAEMFKRHDNRLRSARSEKEFEDAKYQNEREFAESEERFRRELLRRDQSVIDNTGIRAKRQQWALARLGVPGFFVTEDPVEIGKQREILRTISEEIDKMDSSQAGSETPNSILSQTLLSELRQGVADVPLQDLLRPILSRNSEPEETKTRPPTPTSSAPPAPNILLSPEIQTLSNLIQIPPATVAQPAFQPNLSELAGLLGLTTAPLPPSPLSTANTQLPPAISYSNLSTLALSFLPDLNFASNFDVNAALLHLLTSSTLPQPNVLPATLPAPIPPPNQMFPAPYPQFNAPSINAGFNHPQISPQIGSDLNQRLINGYVPPQNPGNTYPPGFY